MARMKRNQEIVVIIHNTQITKDKKEMDYHTVINMELTVHGKDKPPLVIAQEKHAKKNG